MKKQYKVWWMGRNLPGYGIKTVHAESEKAAIKIAKEVYPNIDIERAEVIR